MDWILKKSYKKEKVCWYIKCIKLKLKESYIKKLMDERSYKPT